MSRHRDVKGMIEDDYYDYDDDYDDYDDYGGSGGGVQAPKKKNNVQKAKAKPVATKPKAAAAAVAKPKAVPVSKKTVPVALAPAKPVPPPKVPDVLLASNNNNKDKASKTALTVVVLGHVDAGKSTVTGRLLYGATKQHNNKNKPINYAWFLDEDEQERAHGVTMDVAVKQLNNTTNFQIVLQDAPGHADYVPAMITGTAAADAALLTVDATDLQTAIKRGQLREHVYLAKGLGVNQILVVLNKMDLVGWDNETAYNAMVAVLTDFLTTSVGYLAKRVRCVPVSGLTGVNIFPDDKDKDNSTDTATLRSWYKGPTLLEALDTFEPPLQQQQKLLEKPVRIVVSDVLESSGTGVGIRAKVVQGWAKQGEKLTVLPVGDETTLTKLSSLHTNSDADSGTTDPTRQLYCVAGEFVDCTITNIESQRISTGSVLARPNNRPTLASRCRAKIFVLDGLAIPLIRGAQAIFHMHHLDIPCNLVVLVRTLKPDGTTTLKERPRALSKSCNAVVELQLAVPVCMEAFTDCRALGRFVLRRSGASIAVGRIEEVMFKKI